MKSPVFEFFENISSQSLQEKTFLSFANRKISYGDFILDIDKINSLPAFDNTSFQEVIIIASEDDHAKILFFFYALRKGLVPIVLDPKMNKDRVHNILKNTSTKILVIDEILIDKWLVNSDLFKIISIGKMIEDNKFFNKLLKRKPASNPVLNQKFPGMMSQATASHSYPDYIDGNDIAYIIYTSGSTSMPKGVIITHENLFSHLKTLKHVYGLGESSTILNILMLEHTDGMMQGPVLTAYCQATLIRHMAFEIAKIPQILAAMYKYRVSHFVAVPAMIALIHHYAPEQYDDSFNTEDFQFIISVSSHIEKELWQNFETKYQIKIVNVYGLTETVAGSFFCGPNEENYKLGTIGKPIDTKAKIIGEDNKEVGVNESGELVVKGKHITQGYFKDNEASKNLFVDGWMRTGDIACKDEEGFYTIVGRKKNIVISGGFNIQPEEVSEVLLMNDEVLECACLGVPDQVFGEKLIAAYVPKTHVEVSALEKFASENLENEKVPVRFLEFEELPKGLSGKVDLPALKKMVTSRLTLHDDQGYNSIEDGVKMAASRAFNKSIDDIHSHHSSQNLNGWDSLAHLEFITNIESTFKIRLNTNKVITMNSIQVAVNIVKDELGR